MHERAIEFLFRSAMLPLLWCVAVSPVYAQLATITAVNVVNGNNEVRVEVTGNVAVNPRIVTTHEGRQIDLEFANTVAELPVREFSINSNGVQRVSVRVDRTHAVSRVTITLFRKQAFAYSRDGAKVVLTLTPRAAQAEVARSKRPETPYGGAPAAASGPWLSLSRKQREPSLPPSTSARAISATQGGQPEQSLPPTTTSAPAPVATSSSISRASDTNSGTVSIRDSSQPPLVVPGKVNIAPTAPSTAPLTFPTAVAVPAQPSTSGDEIKSDPAVVGRSNQVVQPVSPQVTTGTTATSVSPVVAQKAAREDFVPVPEANAASATPLPAPTSDQKIPSDSSGAVGQPTDTVQVGGVDTKTAFRVKYVADGAAYLDGGRAAGLAEGVKLVIRDPVPADARAADSKEPVVVAQLEVVSVAESSAVTEIHSPTREVKPGDLAYLTSEDAAALVQQRALSSTRAYPQVITFTEGDPADEEARDEVPRPPLPEVNQARGRIGFEYSSILNHGSLGGNSSELGLVLRSDITRIGGSYWNLSGYWRGRLESQGSSSQQTLQDLINRTYHLSLTYDNPKSRWVMGVGRMFLPWASSLETIDGGYIGRKLSSGVTAGIFAGSTPDPTSWSYNPNQRLAGSFVNFEGGSYDAVHYTSTSGFGLSMLHFNVDRPFVFFENGIFYKRFISIYDSLQIDHPSPTPAVTNPGTGISRSYLTVRVQPIERLAIDFNHTYFRDIPTYDLSLVGTGLLDKALFQGFSVGARVEVGKKIWLYTDQGLSSRSGDASNSKNQMYGISWADILRSGVRADLRYSKFDSPFAQGSYEAIAISRNFKGNFRWEIQAGKQAFVSPLSTDTGSRFINFSLDSDFGAHYFLTGGLGVNRGGIQNYDQWYITLGYRFDNRWKNKEK